ncbi:hypothetical protein AGDE_06967 [Angomonas deanei]|nr:hypothetical protein AGDE_06967 [Angomonas deanei]|eukprot:EPY36330.1 hypothetical protein AGDE_06967 [Angomonas deanei]
MQVAVKRSRGNCKILLEGICDNQEEEEAQLKEFHSIMNSKSLREKIILKADENNLHSPKTMQEICAELALDYTTVMENANQIRLMECYLKPKLAATVGLNLVNNVDTDMKGVQRLLKEEEGRLEAIGESLPTSIAVGDLGQFPLIKKYRERKVAEAARRQCERWIKEEIEGEVIIPWGYFHIDSIEHYIVQGNRGSEDGTNNAEDEKKLAVFVEADELLAKVDFGISKEIFLKAKTGEGTARWRRHRNKFEWKQRRM